VLRALGWAVRGRRDVGADDVVLGYAERSTVMLWAVSSLGLLEIGVVHVLTARWPLARWVLLAVGVVGLVGFLAWGLSLRQHPHVLRDRTLLLRSGRTRAVALPLDTVRTVRRHVVGGHGRVVGVDEGVLVVAFMGDTNVELRLDPPADVEVRRRTVRLSTVRFYADDPRAAVRALTSSADGAPAAR